MSAAPPRWGRLARGRAIAAVFRRHSLAPWALGAASLGALGFALFGTTPGRSVREVAPPAEWALQTPAAPATADAQAVLSSLATWASQPAVLAADEPGRAPSPRLVAVIDVRGQPRSAVFEWPDGRRGRVAQGAPLGDEGPIDIIDRTTVRWRTASGQVLEARLFVHPESREVPTPSDTPAD